MKSINNLGLSWVLFAASLLVGCNKGSHQTSQNDNALAAKSYRNPSAVCSRAEKVRQADSGRGWDSWRSVRFSGSGGGVLLTASAAVLRGHQPKSPWRPVEALSWSPFRRANGPKAGRAFRE